MFTTLELETVLSSLRHNVSGGMWFNQGALNFMNVTYDFNLYNVSSYYKLNNIMPI